MCEFNSATAVAYPNIALIKYWGKRDENYVLPTGDSLSMTLDVMPTTTTVRLSNPLEKDRFSLNGKVADEKTAGRVRDILDIVRAVVGRTERADVSSVNEVPTAAGLASSASGFAALASASAEAYGLTLDGPWLSRLARRGSGSAARSTVGGFARWAAGIGGGAAADPTSYAYAVPAAVDASILVVIVDSGSKSIGSREAMRHTAATSPLYRAWVEATADDVERMQTALAEGDLIGVGELTEANALGMHATMLAARPAVRYISAASLAVLDQVRELRSRGHLAYATMDAGPNVKVLCERTAAVSLADELRIVPGVVKVIVAGSGPGVTLVGRSS